MGKLFIYIILFGIASGVNAQSLLNKSIVQEQSEHYQSLKLHSEKQYDSLRSVDNNSGKIISSEQNLNSSVCNLNKKVFGWHPYWNGTTYTNYQWSLLSDLCYFDYSVSSSTGNNTNGSFAWNTASVVTVAQANGTKVHICATMFSGHSTFWASVTAQNTFINNIISLLNTRQGNGVNIDFEGMGASDKVPFTNFITNLNTALNTANPNYQLSVCVYAVDWSGVFDIPNLNNQVNFYTLMGYDYYYGGSAQAGPTAPLYNFQPGYNYTLPKSISVYLKQGMPQNKLVLGLPYYGREWEVVGNTVPANTTGLFNASRTLAYINNTPVTYTNANKYWEGNCYSPYYKYISAGNNRQCFIDDVYSLGRKYDMVNQRGLAGIGIWAIGYDDGMSAYWTLIQNKFSSCSPIICSDSIFDMGGPTRNYYDNEKYAYTLSAPTGSLVQLQFKSFGTELNFDSLWLYNGTNTLSPLIGAYTGTNSPGNITSVGQNLTLRFKSDGSTNSFGFKAIKSCTPQAVMVSIGSVDRSDDEIRLFPNPTNGELNLTVKSIRSIEVFDINGKSVYKYEGNNSKNVISFAKMNVDKGVYFIFIKDENKNTIYRKIIYSE